MVTYSSSPKVLVIITMKALGNSHTDRLGADHTAPMHSFPYSTTNTINFYYTVLVDMDEAFLNISFLLYSCHEHCSTAAFGVSPPREKRGKKIKCSYSILWFPYDVMAYIQENQ